MTRLKDMTKGNPLHLLLTFAFPLMLGNLGQQLYMIVDAIVVGRGVGVKALAAVGATDWTYCLILWVIQALTQGFSTRISQHFGEGDFKELKKDITMSIILCLVIGSILTIISLLLVNPLLRILKTPEDIFGGASSYLFTMFLGTMVVTGYNMTASILRALGDGKTPLIAMIIAASTNIILDFLFIMGFHWGIVGAAAATLVAQLISFIYCLWIIQKIDFIKMQPDDWKMNFSTIKYLCSMGVPLALQNVLIAIGGMILQSTINKQGFVFVAGFTATNKIYGLLESTALALNYSMTTYTAQNYGAGLNNRIHEGLKSATIISIFISICISILMILFGKYILQLFISSSDNSATETLSIAYRYLVTMSCLLWTLYLLHIYRSTLQGLGDAIGPMISGIIEFIMRVTAALLFTQIWGTSAIFFAEALAWIGGGAFVVVDCIIKLKKEIPYKSEKSF